MRFLTSSCPAFSPWNVAGVAAAVPVVDVDLGAAAAAAAGDGRVAPADGAAVEAVWT